MDERFVVWLPTGRAINPITRTNWEGTGVSPHVEVPQEQALNVAHQLAMEKLAEKAEAKADKHYYEWYHRHLKARNEPPELTEKQLHRYAGQYGVRSLIYEKGALFTNDQDGPEWP